MFVCMATDPQWPEERRKVVTGSSLAALMDCGGFKTRDELFQSYVDPEGTEFKQSRYMWWGSELEEPNGHAAAGLLGKVYKPFNGFYTKGVLGCTTDGYFYGDLGEGSFPDPSSAPTYWRKFQEELSEAPENLWVELKNVGDNRRAEWSTPPEYYWSQCQAQMYCLDEPCMALIAKIGSADIRGHVVKRDDFWLEEAVEKAEAFMEEVRNYGS